MDHHWNKKWKMKWNCECTHLQLTLVTGVAQSMLNYPGISMAVISSQKCYEHLCSGRTTVAEVPYMEGFICKRKLYVDAGRV